MAIRPQNNEGRPRAAFSFVGQEIGWGTRTRTSIDGVRIRCPTIRRSPNASAVTARALALLTGRVTSMGRAHAEALSIGGALRGLRIRPSLGMLGAVETQNGSDAGEAG